MSGGSVALDAFDRSLVNISGAAIVRNLSASNDSRVIITGGTVSGTLFLCDCSTVSLYEGWELNDGSPEAITGWIRYKLSGPLAGDESSAKGMVVYVQNTTDCGRIQRLNFSNSTLPAETPLGTDPHDPDTDDDGLLDEAEVDMAMAREGTCPDPLNPDSDGDTLLDGDEVAMGTNPCLADRKLTSLNPAIL